jgi:cobalamin biosynthesis Mg chelatase CobN
VKEYTVDKAFTGVTTRIFIDGVGDTNEVKFNITEAGTFKVVYDPETKTTTVVGDNVKDSEVVPAPTGSDATSATGTTSGSSSGGSSGSSSSGSTTSNGAVQTGTASMAIIILLVLVSATAGIYFARKRVK